MIGMEEDEEGLATWMMKVEARLAKLESDMDFVKKILILILADIIGITFTVVTALLKGG